MAPENQAPTSTVYKAEKSRAPIPKPDLIWKDGLAEGTFSTLRKMRHTRGDNDVHTQKGRSTNVTLRVHNLRISDDGRSWIADIFYAVAEGHKDYTTFQFGGSVSLAIPEDAVHGRSFITNARAYDRSWVVNGKTHDIMDVPYKENTVVSDGSIYRIDSKGDDEGAVFAELHLKVPFRYLDASP